MIDKVFNSKLSSVMTDNLYNRYVPGQKRGKLDGKRLWKIHTNSASVFRQKMERKGKYYSVVLLVDGSGSMYNGDRVRPAADTAKFMAKALEDNSINFALVTYNCKIVTHKKFKESFNSTLSDFERQLEMRANYENYGDGEFFKEYGEKFGDEYQDEDIYNRCSGGNHDYDAIEKGYELLSKQKGQKILIVFSDGQPHCDRPYMCGYDQGLHEAHKIRHLIGANKNVKTIGVGIQTDVSSYYDSNIRIDNLSDFKTKIIKLLSKQIKRF